MAPTRTSTPDRVLFVLPYMEAGGTERHVLHLVRRLHRDHRVALLSPEGPMLDEFLQLGIEYRPFPRLEKNLFAGLREFRRGLRQLINDFDPSVVHVHAAAELALLVRTVNGSIPVVLTTHGFAVANPDANYRLAAWICRLGRVKKVIGVSRSEAQMLHRGGLTESRLRVVHNGIPDLEEPPINWRERLGWPVDAPVIGAVGRLEPVKGFHLLLDAIAALPDELGPAWALPPRIVIVGDGSERDALERQAAELGLAERVHFAGYRPDAYRAPGGFDVMVIPSLQEAFGLVCLEAMAAGCPVIASDVGGLPELVRDGETGLLVPAGDADALVEALVRLLGDRDGARRMGALARQRFLQDFHVERMVERTRDIYSEVVA